MRFNATLPLDDLRQMMRSRVNDIRSQLIASGYLFDGHRYDTDSSSLANLTAVVAAVGAGLTLPDGFVWRTADNEDVAHTDQSIVMLGGAMVAHVSAIYARSFQLKNEIAASDAPETVDIQNGWP